jgi:hypothetical protein
VITAPDILFTTADLTAGPGQPTAISALARSFPNFNTSQVATNQAGPGTIEPGIVVTFNNVGPVFINSGPYFLVGGINYSPDANSSYVFQWGSFDGTTNAPIVYPDTLSLASLEAQIYFQITNTPVTTKVNLPFSEQLGALGATPPYSWSLAANSPGLPPGLTNGVSSSGMISGTPTTTGTYDFTVQATDQGQRITQKVITITVTP